MKLAAVCARVASALVLMLAAATAAFAQNYPAPKEGTWVARDFKFNTGEVMSELKLHYRTLGEPANEAVIVLHGTSQTGGALLNPSFAGELFGPGQVLDATKYFIVLPDGIGHGKSSKPSDGLRAKFPRYNYDDMVAAQHRLVTEGLGLKRARLIIGNSMGGMQAWLWASAYPDFADALVPMAAQPTEMSSRNWMMRRMIIDAVRNDPAWKGGDYTEQPQAFRIANVFFGISTIGGTLAYQKQAPTREAADKLLEQRYAAATKMDANDFLYAWDSSRDYNAAPGLERITAPLLAINAADDERNPPETGLMEDALKRVKGGKLLLIPASDETRGHAATGMAKFYKRELGDFLAAVPRRGM